MGANRPPSEGVECRLGSSIIKTASPKKKRRLGTGALADSKCASESVLTQCCGGHISVRHGRSLR